jgi:plasmid stabilization system protein ParE
VTVLYSSQARADVAHALRYLAARNPAAAGKLESALEHLEDQLDSGELEGRLESLKSGEEVRSWPFAPWRLYYQRHPDGVLWVVRFYHQRRRPLTRRRSRESAGKKRR